MPMLDLSALGGASPFGGMLNLPASEGFPAEPDPAALAQAAREAAANRLMRSGKHEASANDYVGGNWPEMFGAGPAVPQAGISGQQVMTPGAYGSLAPFMPQSGFAQGIDPVAPDGPATVAALPPAIAVPAIPMPRPRPDSAPQEPDDALPANAQPTAGRTPAPAASSSQPDVPDSSLLGRISRGLSNNGNALVGLGAGIAGGGSWGEAISRGLTGAAAGGQLDLKQQLQAQQLALTQGGARATYQALIDAGAPKQQAIIAAYNPESAASKTLITSYLADRGKKVQLIKDASGREIPYEVNQFPKDGEPVLKPINTAGMPGQVQAGEPSYDPVTRRDEAYLKTLSPEDQSAVVAAANGDILPSGRNLQRLMPLITRYENGFTDRDYKARNKFTTEWGSNASNSYGGQKTLMGTSLGHLADAAEAAAAMENVNGLGSADVAHAANAVKNRTTANAAHANRLNDTVAKFSGEVGKLYSGSTGGGVHEREETRKRLGSNMSAEELVSGLEANRDLIRSKQQALEQHAIDVFGPEGAKKYDFLGQNGRAALAKIDTAIAKLKGEQPAAQESVPSGPRKTSTGVGWSIQ